MCRIAHASKCLDRAARALALALLASLLLAFVPALKGGALAQDSAEAREDGPEAIEPKDYKQEVVSLVERAQAYIKENGEPQQRSGKQEKYEMMLNMYV